MSPVPPMRDRFVRLMLPIAREEEARSNIHPLITITQSAHESNWGESGLTIKANNLFGFTGDSWEKAGKPVIKLPTQEFISGSGADAEGKPRPGRWITIQRPFRAYDSWAESVRDWAQLLHRSRYISALAAAVKGDLDTFALEVSRAGYATDPSYPALLIRVGNVVRQIMGVADGTA